MKDSVALVNWKNKKWMEVVRAQFKNILSNMPGGTEKIHEKIVRMGGARKEFSTNRFLVQIRRVAVSTTCAFCTYTEAHASWKESHYGSSLRRRFT